jgi:hypothetical protein
MAIPPVLGGIVVMVRGIFLFTGFLPAQPPGVLSLVMAKEWGVICFTNRKVDAGKPSRSYGGSSAAAIEGRYRASRISCVPPKRSLGGDIVSGSSKLKVG